MSELIVKVPRITHRLSYAFDIVLSRLLGLRYHLLTEEEIPDETQNPVLIYGNKPVGKHLFQQSVPLLFNREIYMHELQPFPIEQVKGIFPVFHEHSLLPLDPFAAVFWVVSRFEEYLPFASDEHGRFEARSSALWEMGILSKPIANIWAMMLGEKLKAYYPGLKIKKPDFKFTPTYDIDQAWAFKHKGFFRTVAAAINDLRRFDLQNLKQRLKVLAKIEPDPFDTFNYQLELQKKYNLQPVYFFLFAEYGRYDKNNPTTNDNYAALIRHLADYALAGIHPSYDTHNDKKKLQSEIAGLAQVLRQPIRLSRQHFLRLRLPITYHHLIDFDITDDYTMGYASLPGFRAGITIPFPYYDLDHDVPTKLMLHPFMLMDGTLCDYMKLGPEAALDVALDIVSTVKDYGGELITLWHNESLSEQKRWVGWRKVYEKIVEAAAL